MTRRKQGQRTLWEGIVEEDVRALWEPWMVEADQLLDDQELIDQVFEAQGKRHEHSARKGRAIDRDDSARVLAEGQRHLNSLR